MLKRFGYGLASWCRRKVLDPLHLILRRGAEPKQLAFSAALGITFGLFPICGVTVFLCGIAIAILGSLCHAPTVMLANFIATPIELRCRILIVTRIALSLYPYHEITALSDPSEFQQLSWVAILMTFLQLAASYLYWLIGKIIPILPALMVPFLRFGEFITGGPHFPLTSDALKKVLTGQASREVLQSILHALLGWLVAAPFILGGLYILCLPCFKILVYKFSEVPSSPKKPLISSPRKSIGSPSEVRLKVRDV